MLTRTMKRCAVERHVLKEISKKQQLSSFLKKKLKKDELQKACLTFVKQGFGEELQELAEDAVEKSEEQQFAQQTAAVARMHDDMPLSALLLPLEKMLKMGVSCRILEKYQKLCCRIFEEQAEELEEMLMHQCKKHLGTGSLQKEKLHQQLSEILVQFMQKRLKHK